MIFPIKRKEHDFMLKHGIFIRRCPVALAMEYIAELSTADPERLEQVLKGLSSIGIEVLPLIMDSYEISAESATRINLLRAIGRVAFDNDYYDPGLLEKIEEIQSQICSTDLSAKNRVRLLATVVKVMGMVGDASTLGKLIVFLTHSDKRVRSNAVEGIAFIIRRWSIEGEHELKDALEMAAKDEDVRVSVTATIALYLVHSVAARNLRNRIDNLCHSSNEEVKNAAVTAAASFDIKSESFFSLFTPDSIFALLRFTKSQGIY
jgi:vesicle coat complex subunit